MRTASAVLLVVTLAACAADPPPQRTASAAAPTPKPPAPPPAPLPPLPPAPPLWSGVMGLEDIPNSTRTYPGERAVGDILVEKTSRWRRTARLEEAIVVPGLEDFSLPAGQPLYATMFQFVRPVTWELPRQRLYNWYWCGQVEARRNVCIAWVSPGRVRVARAPSPGEIFVSHDPERSWVEIAEPKIVEQPIDLPVHHHSLALRKVDEKEVTLVDTTREGDAASSHIPVPVKWNEARRTWIDNSEMRFEPVRGADGTIRAVTVTFSPASPF